MIKLIDILLEGRTPLKDTKGSIIGTLELKSNGVNVLRDTKGRLIGIYNPKTNKTHSHTGTIVGQGNVLTSLLTIYK